MVRTVSLAILIGVLTAITPPASADDDIAAADLWYPGDIGSYWKYELPPAGETTATITKTIDIDGKTYRLIEETEPFFGVIDPTTSGHYDPFLTFRQDGPDRIWGYGEAANKVFEGLLTEILEVFLVEAGIPKDIVEIQPLSDEWLLLETLDIGHEWTVMQLEATSDWGVRGPFGIGGQLHKTENIQTKAGVFNSFVVEYFMQFRIFNEFGLLRASQEWPLFTAWLTPNVGIVQAAIENEIIGRLTEYHIEGAVVPPSGPIPVADFTYCPQIPEVGDWVILDASASHVSSGKIELYEWDWNNDGTFEALSMLSWKRHYWHRKGSYQVSLRVTTDRETTSVTTKTITVEKQSFRERFWEKLKGWWPGGEEEISDDELTDIKARLNIQNFPSGLPPECIGKIEKDEEEVDFTWYNDEVLKLTLGKELDANTPGLTYYIYIKNALDEVDMVEYIWTQENKKKASKFFKLMAGSNESWSSTATIATKGLLTGLLSQPYSSGVSTLLLAFDMVKIGISIKVLDDLFTANSIFGYLSGRVVAGDHESAWAFTPVPVLATPQEKKSLEEYLRRLGNTYEEALAKDKLDELRYEVKERLRNMLYSAIQELPSELLQQQVVTVKSPVELRVYDSNGNVTGIIAGQLQEGIPHSLYDPETKTVVIFGSSDNYLYEVSGTNSGEYGLEINAVQQEGVVTFTSVGIPVSTKELHQYSIDWNILSEGAEGVIVQIDANADGEFEQTVIVDNNLTLEEYLAVTPQGKCITTWGWVKQIKLFQNYPNPFNPETWIPYQLAEESEVVIRIFTAGGRLIQTLELGAKPSGFYVSKDRAAYWDGCDESGESVASGVYFYCLQAGDFIETKKMVIAK